MILEKLRTPNGKKFLLCAVVVFTIAVVVVGRATFGGVVREYNLPYAEWTTGMFVLQGAMVMVYSSIFTILCSIPLGFYFLGSDNQH
ncbi:DUF2534 family protein [Kluyvera ascorbata]|jgi:Protein of unknown function (DUF2534).|uniref:DUF2534 family protein n=1 Tax=Kluyvera ascorbata TaxID=51288 RepID=A0AB35X8E6_9ENTR|nr:DUF2534 family protein [Kluyvera ascorbata]BBV66465.1 hypothetical protein STW0522KLE44_28530 [Klebsiella sp. STW0522-44]HEB4876130.1 DUF2534 family protein [Kluyvera ascorbata F0526]EJG2387902.1 DUF2534 family protein [Kluyvera ascorbata]KFC88128.1 putative inner membrane protein [Kluyvera ascorbata ATCC 33433]MDT8702655.1 DUF2534 family protein [Kluyvera ascorbata]